MEESKKNKKWVIISIVAIIVIIVLAVILNNNNKGSDGKLDKTGGKAKKENVKIVKIRTGKIKEHGV